MKADNKYSRWMNRMRATSRRTRRIPVFTYTISLVPQENNTLINYPGIPSFTHNLGNNNWVSFKPSNSPGATLHVSVQGAFNLSQKDKRHFAELLLNVQSNEPALLFHLVNIKQKAVYLIPKDPTKKSFMIVQLPPQSLSEHDCWDDQLLRAIPVSGFSYLVFEMWAKLKPKNNKIRKQKNKRFILKQSNLTNWRNNSALNLISIEGQNRVSEYLLPIPEIEPWSFKIFDLPVNFSISPLIDKPIPNDFISNQFDSKFHVGVGIFAGFFGHKITKTRKRNIFFEMSKLKVQQ